MDQTKPPGIQIGQIFLSKVHFEHAPSALTIPPNTPVPDIKTVVNARIAVNEDRDAKSGFVGLTVESAADAESLYRFKVEMIALVNVGTEPNLSLREYLARSGPATLYPFAREVVANLTSKGRFGPIWIPPMNFVAIGEQLMAAPVQERVAGEIL